MGVDLSVAKKSLGSGRLLAAPETSEAFLRSILEIVRSAVGAHASIAIAIPDAIGRLRVVARSGDDGHGGRLRSARRREAFGSGRLIEVSPGHTSDSRLAIIPLVAHARSLGVVEVLAPAAVLDARLGRVSGAVDRCAAWLAESTDRPELAPSSDDLLELCSGLIRAKTKAQAVAATVEACGEHLRAPIAGVLPDRSGPGWFVAATARLGKRRSAELRAAMRDVPQALGRNGGSTVLLSNAFSSVLGTIACSAVAGPAVLLVAGPEGERAGFISVAARLLGTSLSSQGEVSGGFGVLDVGIGWTAHEFRSPVLAARSAIDHVLEDAAELGEGTNRALLLRARSELGYLAELVEPLLSWAAGSGKLLRRRTDVVRVVREAVASCTGDPRDDRVTIEAPDRLPGWVDGGQLRCAIANVVRNALAYSPADTGVSVTVGVDHGDASICVRDLGPGIPPEERKEIFEPFARGTAGASRRSGRGLGLFIAKRILEAHGGTITVASEGRRTSFCMRVPLERRVRRWTS